MTIDLTIDGETYGHDVSVNIDNDGIYNAYASVHAHFKQRFDMALRNGRAGGHGTTLEGALTGLRHDLKKTYDFAGLGLRVGR